MDQIFTIRMMMEKFWEYGNSMFQVPVSYKQAYDRVHRDSMCNILKEFQIAKKITLLIKACYAHMNVRLDLEKTLHHLLE